LRETLSDFYDHASLESIPVNTVEASFASKSTNSRVMADGFDYDADEFDYDDWLYVEDEFDLVDELAETQIADPGYAGTNYEINVDGYDFELFDFWNDLEYVDNAYWDDVSVPIRKLDARGKAQKGASRGLKATAKRLRAGDGTGSSIRGYDPISYRSRAERDHYVAKASPMISSRFQTGE